MSTSTTKTKNVDYVGIVLKFIRYVIKFIGRWGTNFSHNFHWGHQTARKFQREIHAFHTRQAGTNPSEGWKFFYGIITVITGFVLYFLLLITSFFKAI